MLVNIQRRKLIFDGEESDLPKIWTELSKAGFNGSVYEARKALASTLGMDFTQKKSLSFFKPSVGAHGFIDGDIYDLNDKGCIYSIASAVDPGAEVGGEEEKDSFDEAAGYSIMIEVGEICLFGEEAGSRLDDFCKAVEDLLKDEKFEDMSNPLAGGMAVLEGEAIEPPSEENLEVANVLRDPQVQDIITQLEGNPAGLVVDDYLAQQSNAEEMEYYIDKLQEVGLVNEELAVFCTKTNQPTIRVKSRAALDQLAAAGVKCSCGEALTDEDTKRLILFDSVYSGVFDVVWVFRVFLINYLLKIGVVQDCIKATTQEDSPDTILYVSFDGHLVVFYLTPDTLGADKIQDVVESLGEFRSFSFISMVSGNVEPGIDSILANAGNCDQFVVLRNVDELNVKLVEVFEKIRTGTITELLGPLSGVCLADLGNAAINRIGLA